MKILINSYAAYKSSLGVRRYFENVLRYLSWDDGIAFTKQSRVKWLNRPHEYIMQGGADRILWSPSHRGPLFAYHHVITVHDCINVEFVHRDDWRLPFFKKLYQQVLSNASIIIAISESTKEALNRHYKIIPGKVCVIKSPLDVGFRTRDKHFSDFSNHPFILMVTNSLPHKNNLHACMALARSTLAKKGISLRIVGSISSDAFSYCLHAGIQVEHYPIISDDMLAVLYTKSQFLFSPSLAEGHNLPIAEALGCGGNVLCSDIPVHREFYNGMVKYFNPHNIEAMTAAIDAALEQQNNWNKKNILHSRSFKDVAADYQALFHAISN